MFPFGTFQMNAFEILLSQDANLKLEEQENLLRGIVSAYARLRQDHEVESDVGDAKQQGPGDVQESEELSFQLCRLDADLSRLTNRVEVYTFESVTNVTKMRS